jgi:hypothetical protein
VESPSGTHLVSEADVREADASSNRNENDKTVSNEQPGLKTNRHVRSGPQETNATYHSAARLGQCVERILESAWLELGNEQLASDRADRIGSIRVYRKRDEENSHASAVREILERSQTVRTQSCQHDRSSACEAVVTTNIQ